MSAFTDQVAKGLACLRWLPAYAGQQLVRRGFRKAGPQHLIVALADHFEPSIVPGVSGRHLDLDEQERRLERWCREYPKMADAHRDGDGFPFRHTYFYPAEQFHKTLIDRLAEHCHDGWGEVEIHLHHGVDAPDTSEATRRVLVEFRDELASRGCLPRWNGQGSSRYAFVHGNWALANSAGGRYCGVDDEMAILAETGCYADLTLPAPLGLPQVGKINSLYECGLPLDQRAPHRRGRRLAVGRSARTFPLIVQGPLMVNALRRVGGRLRPGIEQGVVVTHDAPTPARLGLWQQAGISVAGRPEWAFIKLSCHGMDPRDEPVMLGAPIQRFLRTLLDAARDDGDRVHFVTAREMVNIALAACDGRDGDPAAYRDYRLRLPGQGRR
jgi:hypothetical protein